MTESSGAGHVDLGVLAELDEGVAGPQVEQAARSHLEHCATCRERMAHLRTTRALLSALPPEPMPEAVQARVDAALANASVEASGTIVPMTRRTRVWNSPAVAGAAAVAAVVVLVGALVVGNVIHHGKKSQTASAPLTSEGNHRGSTADAASIKEWATGANYTAATLPNLVPRLVTGTPPPGAPGATSAGGGTAFSGSGSTTSKSAQGTAPVATAVPAGAITQDAMRANSSAVLACGTILAGGVPTVPVAVDFASWNGKPAVIFALPAVGHPELLDVWVVRSNCSTSSLDVYFRRIPRPAG